MFIKYDTAAGGMELPVTAVYTSQPARQHASVQACGSPAFGLNFNEVFYFLCQNMFDVIIQSTS